MKYTISAIVAFNVPAFAAASGSFDSFFGITPYSFGLAVRPTKANAIRDAFLARRHIIEKAVEQARHTPA